MLWTLNERERRGGQSARSQNERPNEEACVVVKYQQFIKGRQVEKRYNLTHTGFDVEHGSRSAYLASFCLGAEKEV